MLFLRLAWRNIWRNRKRTLITVIALSFGVSGIVFQHSYGQGPSPGGNSGTFSMTWWCP